MEIIGEYLKTKFKFDFLESYVYFNKHNEELMNYMLNNNHKNYIILTAFNPYPIINNNPTNFNFHKDLLDKIKKEYSHFEGFGYSSDEKHHEKHIIIFNMDINKGIELGNHYNQLAICYGNLKQMNLLIIK
jgi:hypothetical protein